MLLFITLVRTRSFFLSAKHPKLAYMVGAGVGAGVGFGVGLSYSWKAKYPPHVAELSPEHGLVHAVDLPCLSKSVPAPPHQHFIARDTKGGDEARSL